MSTTRATVGPDSSPIDRLLDLHRAGRLVAEYPTAQSLLRELSGPDLSRAGRLLARTDPAEILRRHPALRAVRVAVTGHGTLGALVPDLTAEFARHGLVLVPHVTRFDSYVFELGDVKSDLYATDPELIVTILDPMVVADELPVPWGVPDAVDVLTRKVRLIEHLVAVSEAAGRGLLVLNTIPLPRWIVCQLVDYRSRAGLAAAWRDANGALLRLMDGHPNLVVLDLDPLVAEGTAVTDPRLCTYAKANLSPGLLTAYAREIAHLARHTAGRTKKCLVVDLDGTLWGGVLGEDGPNGIEVAETYRGAAFQRFQRIVKQLCSQGVLLAAVSKNDHEVVHQVLRDHPAMTLHEEDFVEVIANWRPKHENLAELARDLNLGVDSMVLADDSAFECRLVLGALPGVAVVALDDEPAFHTQRLLHDGWFDVREVTAEDRHRTTAYRQELARKSFLDSFDSITDYLRGLDIRVELSTASRSDAPRISQLTLRTNQFNLTTRRMQQRDVLDLIDDPASFVLSIRSSDRFGGNGMVGTVIGRFAADTMYIDNFLLSCRVFSRGIEQACLAAVLGDARARGVVSAVGVYRPSAKNAIVHDFYTRHGFVRDDSGDDALVFRHDLAAIPPVPAHITLRSRIGGESSDNSG